MEDAPALVLCDWNSKRDFTSHQFPDHGVYDFSRAAKRPGDSVGARDKNDASAGQEYLLPHHNLVKSCVPMPDIAVATNNTISI